MVTKSEAGPLSSLSVKEMGMRLIQAHVGSTPLHVRDKVGDSRGRSRA